MHNTTKHLWIINQYALPKGSAGITRHGDFAYLLSQMGYKVTVFASGFDHFRRQANLKAEQTKGVRVTNHEGVDFVWIKTPAYTGNDNKRVRNMATFFARVVNEAALGQFGRPDVVLGSSPHLLSGLAGSLLAMRYRAPFILELRDVWPEDLVALGALETSSTSYKILKRISNFLNTRADKILTVPPKLHKHLAVEGIPLQKLKPLPNGTFLDDVAGEPLPESLKQVFELEKDQFKLVYMGAHGVANNLANVLDTAVYLREHKPKLFKQLAFIFVGGGQQKQALLERAKAENLSNVHFHEPVAKPVVPSVTASADALLVHLHEADTFSTFGRSPNKLYDYLAAAKPILFSTTDQSTILTREDAGLIFEPSKPEAFADALENLLSMSASEQKQLGLNGRAAVEREHNLVELAEQLADVIEDLSRVAKLPRVSPLLEKAMRDETI